MTKDDDLTGLAWLSAKTHPAIAGIWTEEWQVRTERRLWMDVLAFHVEHRVAPASALPRYEQCAHIVDLERIRQRELRTRHDVKARIEEFCYLAGGIEYIHLGMTSADVVDNISLYKMAESLRVMAGRHPAHAEDLMRIRAAIPWRGIKGAMGTSQDQLDLLGSIEAVEALDRYTATRFGFDPGRVLVAVGQVYHRSIDLQVASGLMSVCLSAGVRAPWSHLVLGYESMIAGYAGETWNEGDVSTSATRRVALPGMFMAAEIGLSAAAGANSGRTQPTDESRHHGRTQGGTQAG